MINFVKKFFQETLPSIVKHPYFFTANIIICFGISFAIGPYFTEANILVITSGISFLALANIVHAKHSIAKFLKNKAKIEQHLTVIKNEKKDEFFIQGLGKENKLRLFFDQHDIKSLDDLQSHLNHIDKKNSTTFLLQKLHTAAGLACFASGSTVQILTLPENKNNNSVAPNAFPPSGFVSAGYFTMEISQLIFMHHLGKSVLEAKELTKMIKQEMHEHYRLGV